MTDKSKAISGRPAANSSVSSTPRILTLGGDHTTTLSALRSTYQRWGPVSVIHFDSHIGTAEPGGWSTRELLTILDGLEGLSVVGADVVEVAPAYDNNGETTILAAAEVAYSLIDLMVLTPVQSKADIGENS
ncbi:putative agmatinase 1 [Colletotrichum spaethianum]|uniref:Agmatinase 1 n=1 Tax=Colletotrichum spaethianum TaxID=700344 RepID=A0AA37LBU2_9PEZI|nr:putative agmatinase 1 [Colletotrichum spaethianum]GKT41457.1 putative agmatinase 1 [Colletotrichum spaethianum]